MVAVRLFTLRIKFSRRLKNTLVLARCGYAEGSEDDTQDTGNERRAEFPGSDVQRISFEGCDEAKHLLGKLLAVVDGLLGSP